MSLREIPVLCLGLALLTSACGPTAGTPGTPTERPLAASSAPQVPTATPTAAPIATPEPDWTTAPNVATDLAPLIEQSLMVERAIRDPNVSGAKLTWMAHLQQLTYGRLADFPDWREPLLAAHPPDIRAIVTKSLDAGKQLRRLSGPTPKELPDWQIVAPAPAEELLGHYRAAEAEFGIGWSYLAAIHLVETRMGRIRGLSSAGAQGPMQFMPPTWGAYGRGDINSDRDSILAAARYLRASGAPADMAMALFAYNRHEGYVNAITLYAQAMEADPAAYRGYHGWQVYYPTVDGVFHLPVGWKKE